jgi:hypothetical protein
MMMMTMANTTATRTPPPSPVSRWCADERSVSCSPPWGRRHDGDRRDANTFSLHDFFHACKTLRDYESCPCEYHDCAETIEIEEDAEAATEEDDLRQGDDHTVTVGDAEFSMFDKATYCMDHDYTYLGEDDEDEYFTPASPTRDALPIKEDEEVPIASHHQPMLPGGGHMRFWYT